MRERENEERKKGKTKKTGQEEREGRGEGDTQEKRVEAEGTHLDPVRHIQKTNSLLQGETERTVGWECEIFQREKQWEETCGIWGRQER